MRATDEVLRALGVPDRHLDDERLRHYAGMIVDPRLTVPDPDTADPDGTTNHTPPWQAAHGDVHGSRDLLARIGFHRIVDRCIELASSSDKQE